MMVVQVILVIDFSHAHVTTGDVILGSDSVAVKAVPTWGCREDSVIVPSSTKLVTFTVTVMLSAASPSQPCLTDTVRVYVDFVS